MIRAGGVSCMRRRGLGWGACCLAGASSSLASGAEAGVEVEAGAGCWASAWASISAWVLARRRRTTTPGWDWLCTTSDLESPCLILERTWLTWSSSRVAISLDTRMSSSRKA